MGEVHKPNCRAFLSCPAVLANACILQKHGKNVAVILDQTDTGEACSELLNYLFYLVIFHPIVDYLELFSEYRHHDHFGKVLPKSIAWALFAVEVDDLPTEAMKLVKERLLDVVTFFKPEVLGCFVLGHQASFALI